MANQKEAFIFIGKSGSGKGTQAELVRKFLSEQKPDEKVVYEETGALFRTFINEASYTAQLSKKHMHTGARQPDFLAVLMWGNMFVRSITGNEHLIIDGSPRALSEAHILDTALAFYGFKVTVFYIHITDEEATRRLSARGREDDKSVEEVEKRLAWFHRDVEPALTYYRTHPAHTFVELNGEAPIEDVHATIIKTLSS